MRAYYNEIEPYAAQWLRNLISEGLIAHGDVDERSIEDITPADLTGYTQCHFFAGIGGWSYALRLAGWGDSRPVWTGSCPCQPFSTAGKGKGTSDERHLWPAWFHLIRECQPCVVFGEQVEAAINHGWLDLVQADMEGIGYAVGASVLPAAGFGASHIRHRLWFVAEALDHSASARHERTVGTSEGKARDETRVCVLGERGEAVELADAQCDEWRQVGADAGWSDSGSGAQGLEQRSVHSGDGNDHGRPGPTNGRWRDADWLFCREGKWRAVEPGTFPLAHGIPRGMGQGIPDVQRLVRNAGKNRTGRLKAYGNAIVPQVAAEVIKAYMECRP